MSHKEATLTQDKNLFSIWRKARKIPSGWVNFSMRMSVAGALFVYVVVGLFGNKPFANSFGRQAVAIADFSFAFAIGMLGFLLAGFTILATFTRTELLVHMAKTKTSKEVGGELTYLEYVFFRFMHVFIHFVVITILCVLVKLFGGKGGAGDALIAAVFADNHAKVVQWVSGIGVFAIGSYLFSVTVQLKAFVFNIYHVVMASIRWAAETEPEVSQK